MVAEFLETMIGTGSERSKYEEYVEKFSAIYEEEGAFDGEYDELQEYLNEVNIQKYLLFCLFPLIFDFDFIFRYISGKFYIGSF